MKYISILLLIFVITLQGQNISSWQNHTNMQNISALIVNGNEIWAGSKGGVFRYFPADSLFQKLTKSEGLSGQTITSLAIDNNKI